MYGAKVEDCRVVFRSHMQCTEVGASHSTGCAGPPRLARWQRSGSGTAEFLAYQSCMLPRATAKPRSVLSSSPDARRLSVSATCPSLATTAAPPLSWALSLVTDVTLKKGKNAKSARRRGLETRTQNCLSAMRCNTATSTALADVSHYGFIPLRVSNMSSKMLM